MMFTLHLQYVVAHCVLKFAKIFVSHSLPRPRYKYETSVSHNTVTNGSEGALPCHTNHTETTADESLDLVTRKGTVHSESGYDGLRFHCCAAVSTLSFRPQPARNQPARLCGSTSSLGTCCAGLERLPSCHWVFLIWMISPEKRTLHSICVGSFILLTVYIWPFFFVVDLSKFGWHNLLICSFCK